MNERIYGTMGITAFVIFWVALFSFGAARPEYSHLHKAVSELGVVGAPNALAWNVIGFIVPGLLLAFFSAGLATTIDGRRGVLWWLLVLSALCFAATGLVPGEMHNGSPMFQSKLTQAHLLMANFSPLLWTIASFLLARRVTKNQNWKSFATPAIVSAIVCVGGFILSIVTAGIIPALLHSPGLSQRFCFAFYFGWFLIMSLHLFLTAPRVK